MGRDDAICNINEVFGSDRPFARGSDTSWYAAHSIPKNRLSKLKRDILDVLRSLYPDGMTDDELAAIMREYRYTVAPRRRWLVLAGLVEDSGQRRPGPRGRKQVVWRFKIGGSYKEQKDPSIRAWVAELTYPAALSQIDMLHHSIKEGQVVPICSACSHIWPCDTNITIEKARRRPKETVK